MNPWWHMRTFSVKFSGISKCKTVGSHLKLLKRNECKIGINSIYWSKLRSFEQIPKSFSAIWRSRRSLNRKTFVLVLGLITENNTYMGRTAATTLLGQLFDDRVQFEPESATVFSDKRFRRIKSKRELCKNTYLLLSLDIWFSFRGDSWILCMIYRID